MNNELTSIVVIQDKSGSMAPRAADVIGGFNAFVARQREAPGRAELTLVQFNGVVDFVYDGLPVEQVAPLDEASYQPGGSTALFEAIGQAVVRTKARIAALAEEERPARVVLVVMTDDQNTDRTEFTPTIVHGMLEEQQKLGWEVIYIGAALDKSRGEEMMRTAASLGVQAASCAVVDNCSEGIGASYNGAAEAVIRYRSGGTAALDLGGSVPHVGEIHVKVGAGVKESK